MLNIQRLRDQIEAGQTLKRTIEEMSDASLATFSAKPLFDQVAETLSRAGAKRIAESSALLADFSKQLTFDVSDIAKPLTYDADAIAKQLTFDTDAIAKQLTFDTDAIAKQLTFNTDAIAKQLTFDTSALDGLRISMGLDREMAGVQELFAQASALTQDRRFQDLFKGLDRQLADLSTLTGRTEWNEMLARSRAVADALNLPRDQTEGVLELPDARTLTPEEQRRAVAFIRRICAILLVIWTFPPVRAAFDITDVVDVITSMIRPAATKEDIEQLRRTLHADLTQLKRDHDIAHPASAPEQQPYHALVVRAAPVYSDSHSGSTRLGRVTKGTTVTVLACERRWCRVEYLDSKREQFQNGWLYAANLKAVDRERQ